MSRLFIVVCVWLWMALTPALRADNLCPSGTQSDKLICLIPQVYGPNGLVLANSVPLGHFQDNFVGASLAPLNSAIGIQSALLPVASPSSGIIFTWDATLKQFVPASGTFGPILAERAETIGRHKAALAFSYQYFNFNRIDGIDTGRMPVAFAQQDDAFDAAPTVCSVNAPANGTKSDGSCGFIRDVVTTSNRVDLKIHQFTTFVTFGITSRLDISAAIPIENIRMGVFSDATIVNNSKSRVHIFPANPPGCPDPCRESSFSNVRNVAGVGDILLRVKGTAWKGERAALAIGADVRMPTGDQLNYLGSGAFGVKPFIVWSYSSWISPHVFVGYETNGNSVLAGDTSTGKKGRLPSQLAYSVGADVKVTKWLSATADVVGQQVFQVRRTSIGTFHELGACQDSNCLSFDQPKMDPTLSVSTASYNSSGISVGTRIKVLRRLLISGNALIKFNDGGLRSTVVPLVSVSYAF